MNFDLGYVGSLGWHLGLENVLIFFYKAITLLLVPSLLAISKGGWGIGPYVGMPWPLFQVRGKV